MTSLPVSHKKRRVNDGRGSYLYTDGSDDANLVTISCVDILKDGVVLRFF